MARQKFNITSHAVFVDLNELVGPFTKLLMKMHIIDFGNVISNQIAYAFKKRDGNLVGLPTWRIWHWRSFYYDELLSPQFLKEPVEFIFFKVLTIFKASFVFAVMSILSSIALHISTISVVVLYIVASTLRLTASKGAALDLPPAVFAVSAECAVSLDWSAVGVLGAQRQV